MSDSNDFKDEGNDPNSTEDLDFEGNESNQKLTSWANEPTLEALKADLEEAMPDHQTHISNVEAWRRNYDGKANFPIKINRSRVVPKVIRKQAEWRYTALSEPFLSTDNMFEVDPITFEDKERALQNSQVLNNQMNQRIDKIKFIDEYVRTAVDEGTVIIKVGWKSEEGMVSLDEPIFDYQPIQNQQEAQVALQKEQMKHQMMIQSPQRYQKELPKEERESHNRYMATGVPHIPIQTGTKRVSKKTLVVNHPTIEICPYDKVILDPTSLGDINNAQFVIYEFTASLSALKKDGRYTNLDKINTKNILEQADTDGDDGDGDDSNFTFKDKPRKRLVAYEYWGYYDINNTGVVEPFIATWVGGVKIRMERNPFPDKKLPFIKVQYLPVTRENYGEPDGALLEDNQQIVGAVTRGMIDMMGRSAAGQQGVRKDALDVTNSRKFEQGEDYKFNASVDPRQAFQMGAFPEIPKSALEMIQMQNFEAEAITGVKTFSQGISGAALGSTATAVRGALDAASKRELGILRRLADGIVQVGRKMISMNSEFLSDEEVIRITNEEFVTVRRDDLAGRFDVRLSISTAEADNEKAQELAFMLQTVGNNLDPHMTQMILVDIARLRKMPKLAQQIKEYQPKPDPIEQKRRELEVALLEAQVANEKAKGDENRVDVGLKTAKTATEQAKARQLGSTADQQDLNFLEQKEGVSHDREMDKMDHKLSGDTNLKQLDIAGKVADTKEKAKKPDAPSLLKNFNL